MNQWVYVVLIVLSQLLLVIASIKEGRDARRRKAELERYIDKMMASNARISDLFAEWTKAERGKEARE
jgi:hypothetical protein